MTNTLLRLLLLASILNLSILVPPARAAEKPLNPGEIATGAQGRRGQVVIGGKATGPILQIAPNSKVTLHPVKDDGLVDLELHSGMVRIQAKAAADKKPVLNLRTRAVTMGVRGTDFVGIATPILGESEIVVLEGKVQFTSATDAKDTKMIDQGHWGGIGGRFGAKTHDLIQLSDEQLKHFDQASTVK